MLRSVNQKTTKGTPHERSCTTKQKRKYLNNYPKKKKNNELTQRIYQKTLKVVVCLPYTTSHSNLQCLSLRSLMPQAQERPALPMYVQQLQEGAQDTRPPPGLAKDNTRPTSTG